MKKLIVLLSVFICFAYTANAQGVFKQTNCLTIVNFPGNGISFGCVTHTVLSDIEMCLFSMRVYDNKGNIKVARYSASFVGVLEYDGNPVPFETPRSPASVIVTPNEEKVIRVIHHIDHKLFDVILQVGVHISVTDNGEEIVDVEFERLICMDD